MAERAGGVAAFDWPAVSLAPGAVVDRPGLRVALHEAGPALMLTGDLAAALARLAPTARSVGLGEEAGDQAGAGTGTETGAGTGPHLVRMGRDRGLLFGAAEPAPAEGWDPAGFAVSAAGDGWLAVSLEGADAEALLSEATATRGGSPSAALLFAGLPALLVRRAGVATVLVEVPRAPALLGWLTAAGAGDGPEADRSPPPR